MLLTTSVWVFMKARSYVVSVPKRHINGILLANKKTHVRLCPALKVPITDQIMKRAQMLVDPLESPVISISYYLTYPKQGQYLEIYKYYNYVKCTREKTI